MGTTKKSQKKYVRAIGPRLRILLYVIFGLVSLLGANSIYLAGITLMEWIDKPQVYQNYFYQLMFLMHLVLGLGLIIPYLIFGIMHMKNAHNRPNKRAVNVGYALFVMGLIVLFTGIGLTRMDIFGFKNVGLKDPQLRSIAYWLHIIAPILSIWLYVLHRLAGPKMKLKVAGRLAGGLAVLVLLMVGLHKTHPTMETDESAEGEKYFEPSSARTASGKFIHESSLMMDQYCLKCHKDAYDGWFHSSHHFSSFNNPFYLFSVKETRDVALKRDGNVKASRWCAGCHDPVPFFSGKFDDPNFDIINDITAHAGITCTSCHAISSVDSVKGNADYTISEPVHYPFAYSTNKFLQYINNQLVKAKPAFHKKMFLKDFMKSEDFCGTCHKVSLPFEVTHYKKWLRGQNHYDSFILSGPGHGARSFYFPPKASANCSTCHMPYQKSDDFGAKSYTGMTGRYIHNHLFPSANTALPHIRGDKDVIEAHEEFSKDSLRVDIFGLKEGGDISSPLTAPLRPQIPELEPGKTYLIEVVLRTLKLGHIFSQGTADSNEIWVEMRAENQNELIGKSGLLKDFNEVDPWSHFVNVYMLDKEGQRIDRRNAHDIFTPLYNNQMPPGTGFVVHYKIKVPENASGSLKLSAKLNYRKFDTRYYNYVFGSDYKPDSGYQLTNDLPIRVIASDEIIFPIAGSRSDQSTSTDQTSSIPEWERWNDYGIGLLLKGNKGSAKGELIQATDAFKKVELLGRPDGPLNLARVYIKEGRLNEAAQALQRVNKFEVPPPPWLVAWLSGVVNKQNGELEEAITQFTSILEDDYEELRQRELDFSKDYIVINELGLTLFELAKRERANKQLQDQLLKKAVNRFKDTLEVDPENLTAHYNLGILYARLGESEKSEYHLSLHSTYKPDDNARDSAVGTARKENPAANNAAQAIVIYDLNREDVN